MIKVIQVGIGGMGNAWLNAVRESDEVEFAGFVEVSDTVIDAQVERYGLDRARIFPALADALDSVQADGVIDVTPPRFHREISLTALKRGIPVLSEKPLAPTPAEAREIVDAAGRTGVLHMVAQNYRYSLAAQTLKQALQYGELGVIGALTVDFFKGPHFGGFREEMDYPLIVDMAIHHFDLMRCLLDADPVSVYGRSWNPSWSWYRGDASASVVIDFGASLTATYTGSWCATGRETTWNGDWRFDCERGVVALQNDQVWLYPLGSDPRLVDPVVLPHTAQAYLLHEFHEAITTGITPATTCADNVKSLGIVFALLDSFKSGVPVML